MARIRTVSADRLRYPVLRSPDQEGRGQEFVDQWAGRAVPRHHLEDLLLRPLRRGCTPGQQLCLAQLDRGQRGQCRGRDGHDAGPMLTRMRSAAPFSSIQALTVGVS